MKEDVKYGRFTQRVDIYYPLLLFGIILNIWYYWDKIINFFIG